MRKFSDQSQILRRITNSNSRIIFVKHHIENPMRRVVSRPEGLHPRPLSERCGNLSIHTAPIKQTHLHMVLPYSSVSSCFQLNAEYNRLTRPLCSGRITGLQRSYGSVRPSAPLRYARLVASTTCASPFTSERLVPAVPHVSLDQLHASYTPVAAYPVIRSPAG